MAGQMQHDSGGKEEDVAGGRPSQGVPASLAAFFPEYDLAELDPVDGRTVIIERVLQHGDTREVRWLLDTYGVDEVGRFVADHGARKLGPRAFAFWRLVLDVRSFRPHPWPEAARAVWVPRD